MKIKLNEFVAKNHALGERLRIIVHVGASFGEEIQAYLNTDPDHVILIEPLPDAYAALCKLADNRKIMAVNAAALDRNGKTKFHRTTNSVSSSIYGISNDKMHDIKYLDEIEVPCKRLDTILEELDFPYSIDLLVIDAQGSEDLVFRGAPKALAHTDMIFTEVSVSPLYLGAVTLDEVDRILSGHGFERVETYLNDRGTGDAVYKRKDR